MIISLQKKIFREENLILCSRRLKKMQRNGSRRQHIAYVLSFERKDISIGEYQLWKLLTISCSFYYLVASTACFVHIMKIQVLAEREQKIQTEVKEIRKVFYCELCNKQYKLAVEFENHLSSYDHNHRKRFKQMKEMHGSSSRDDRQKREQQRQEREMAKFAQMADAHKQQKQQKQQQQEEESGSTPATVATAVAKQDQRGALKFGFSSKGGPSKSKNPKGSAAPKPKVAVASVFGNDSDEE